MGNTNKHYHKIGDGEVVIVDEWNRTPSLDDIHDIEGKVKPVKVDPDIREEYRKHKENIVEHRKSIIKED